MSVEEIGPPGLTRSGDTETALYSRRAGACGRNSGTTAFLCVMVCALLSTAIYASLYTAVTGIFDFSNFIEFGSGARGIDVAFRQLRVGVQLAFERARPISHVVVVLFGFGLPHFLR